MGSRAGMINPPPSGSLVSLQAAVTLNGSTVLTGAPALIGAQNEAASLLTDPLFT
jgi:hypothetical protein